MQEYNNVLFMHSGGPSPTLNSGLIGTVDACEANPTFFGKLMAAKNGLEGLLREELIDLNAQDNVQMQLIKNTPGSAIGTGRYPIDQRCEEDYKRIFEVLDAQKVGYFFIQGGNGSMQLIEELEKRKEQYGMKDLVMVGIPKTIDNDLGGPFDPYSGSFSVLDHSPGFPSVMRHWANQAILANLENMASYRDHQVLVSNCFGRHTGHIAASPRLVDLVAPMHPQYSKETGSDPLFPFVFAINEAKPWKRVEQNKNLSDNDKLCMELKNTELLIHEIKEIIVQYGRAVVFASEGYALQVSAEDQKKMGMTAMQLAPTDTNSNTQKQYSVTSPVCLDLVNFLAIRGIKARYNAPGTGQREDIFTLTELDVNETYMHGQNAVNLAMKRVSGVMSTLTRLPGQTIYVPQFGQVETSQLNKSPREFPDQFTTGRFDITPAFKTWAAPLINSDGVTIRMHNGILSVGYLNKEVLVKKKCDYYVPIKCRN